MTITITERANLVESNTSSQSDTSASFTPVSSGKLYVVSGFQRTGTGVTLNPTISVTHTGVGSFTRLLFPTPAAWNGDTTFHGSIALWEADTTTPSAGTVTIDWADSTGTCWGAFKVFDAVGDSGTVQIKSGQVVGNATSKGGGNAETHTSATLPGTTVSGNTVIGCIGCSIDSNGAASTPSGWTAVGTPQTNIVTTIGVWKKTDFAGTSLAWTDCGQQVGTAYAALFELEETGGGGGPLQDSNFFEFF